MEKLKGRVMVDDKICDPRFLQVNRGILGVAELAGACAPYIEAKMGFDQQVQSTDMALPEFKV